MIRISYHHIVFVALLEIGKTTMIATISPEAQFTDESVSTCHFAQRVALVKNSASVNEEVEPELVIQRLRAEVRRLREEVEFLSRKNDNDEGDGGETHAQELSPQQMSELTESIHNYVQDRDKSSHLDFCGGITLPRIRAVCSIFKDFLLRKPNERIVDDEKSNSDDESLEKNERSFTPKNKAIGQNVREEGRSTTQAPSDNGSEKGNRSKANNCVCGVPLCRDQRVITEPNLAFAWFKDRYPGTAAIDESKNLLKTKITEVYYFCQRVACRFCYSLDNLYATNNHLLLIQAKNTGRMIEEIRSRIRQHKEAIEKVRASHAISMVSGHEEKLSECVEEKLHCDAIIKEKVAYKETLDRLGGLKGSIEKIQQLVETSRLKLQADFETWYRQVCSEENRSNDDAESRLYTRGNEDRREEMTCDARRPSLSVDEVRGHAGDKPEVGKQPTAETQKEFNLPAGVKLTGNHQVDEDIIAFYKAKEVLLSKLKR